MVNAFRKFRPTPGKGTALRAALAIVAVTTMLFSGRATNARTLTFDFATADSGGWSQALYYSAGPMRLTVTATDTSNRQKAKVQSWAGLGLGVRSVRDCPTGGVCTGTDAEIDATKRRDIAVLTFDRPVSITGLTFSGASAPETFDFYENGARLGQMPTTQSVLLFSGLGTTFGVGAGISGRVICAPVKVRGQKQCPMVYTYSSFYLRALTVELAGVPVPAGSGMLASAIGVLALRRRPGPRSAASCQATRRVA